MSGAYGAAPMWPPMPTKPPTAGRPWWRRHKGWLGLGIGVLVVGLVAGLPVWRGSRESAPDRGPFVTALADLAAQPAIRYRTSLGSAAGSVDLQVTSAGDTMGTVSVLGEKISTLTINGTSYVRMPNLLGSKSPDPTGLSGKWVTGRTAPATAGAGAEPKDARTPAALANRLYSALDDRATVLTTKDDPDDAVDGTPTMKAATPEGDLFITRAQPYRLLRYVPHTAGSGPSGLPSLPSLPSLPDLPPNLPTDFPSDLPSGFPTDLPSGLPSIPSLPSNLPSGLLPAQRILATAPTGTLDLTELSPQDVDRFFQQLETETKQLKNTVDADIHFSLKGSADLKCSSGGCRVTAHVTSEVESSDPKAEITGGKVNATLSATVEIEGEAAGGCTATRVLPLKGTSDIACEDAGAGPVFTEQDTLKREEAEAESEAEDGAEVPYTVSSTGEAQVEALAQVDVNAMLMLEQLEQQILDEIRQDEPSPTASGRPSQQPSATATPSGAPSPNPTSSPPGGKDDRKKKKKPTCRDQRPGGAEKNGPGWSFYSPAGFRNRATAATACLYRTVRKGTKADPNSPGMAEAKVRARELFPDLPQKYLVNSCHLIPDKLGGRGVFRNLSPCWTTPVNVGEMTAVQTCVKSLMQASVVEMTVIAEYRQDTDRTPEGFDFIVRAWTPQGDALPATCSRSVANVKNGKNLADEPSDD